MNDWYRAQDIDRERRAAEIRQQENDANYRYWWDPTQGFWAWMRRQDEYRQRLAGEDANREFELWLRQQGQTNEPRGLNSTDAGAEGNHMDIERLIAIGRHDELPQLPVISEYSTVDGHSRSGLNKAFMDETLTLIASERETGRKHLLDFLLTAEGDDWLSRRADAEVPTVQAGHLLSRQALRQERFALEDSTYNQLSNNWGETQGYIFGKEAVDISGVAVERRTAEMWERTGLLPSGTVENSKVHSGWMGSKEDGNASDWYRAQEVERERRQQEQIKMDGDAVYTYWWHPTQGFWAWLRRQEESHQWRSREEAKLQFESWLRQQVLSAETSNSSTSDQAQLLDSLAGSNARSSEAWARGLGSI